MRMDTGAYPTALFPAIDTEATGKHVYELLAAHGYSAKKTATLLGSIEVQTVYNWKYGRRMPSIDNLDMISRLLHVSINDLLVHDSDDEVIVFACTVSDCGYITEIYADLRKTACIAMQERTELYAQKISAAPAA